MPLFGERLWRVRGRDMLLQRMALTALAVLLAFDTSLAQQAGGFVGQWQGTPRTDGNQEAAITRSLERPDANDRGSAKLGPGCDALLSAIRLSADATLAAMVLDSSPLRLSDVSLDSVRA